MFTLKDLSRPILMSADCIPDDIQDNDNDSDNDENGSNCTMII